MSAGALDAGAVDALDEEEDAAHSATAEEDAEEDEGSAMAVAAAVEAAVEEAVADSVAAAAEDEAEDDSVAVARDSAAIAIAIDKDMEIVRGLVEVDDALDDERGIGMKRKARFERAKTRAPTTLTRLGERARVRASLRVAPVCAFAKRLGIEYTL